MRTAVVAALIALVGGVAGGCGGGDDERPSGVTGTIPEPTPMEMLCQELGEKADEAQLRASAKEALVGLRLGEAERYAEAYGCHVAPTSIDGEPQPLTREYDPTRIQVEVRDDRVRKVLGFG
jgi:hypothetical protein